MSRSLGVDRIVRLHTALNGGAVRVQATVYDARSGRPVAGTRRSEPTASAEALVAPLVELVRSRARGPGPALLEPCDETRPCGRLQQCEHGVCVAREAGPVWSNPWLWVGAGALAAGVAATVLVVSAASSPPEGTLALRF